MTFDSARSDLLIALPSLSLRPYVFDFDAPSEPAKSTRLIWLVLRILRPV